MSLSPYSRNSAALLGITCCHACRTTVRIPPSHAAAVHCPICLVPISLRRTDSVQRTWAWLLTAMICYIPANVYPIMTVVHFGRGSADTIASGIAHLAAAGQWPIAILILFASIVVPALKIMGLGFLLLCVQRKLQWRPAERGRLFHLIHAIGRWSMIDIFMISILVALVQLGSVATVIPGAGAAFFAAVILATLFAAMSFDERLLWDVVDG